MMKLSNEQLTRLALHLMGINNILAESMLHDAPGAKRELEIDVFVADTGAKNPEPKKEPEAQSLDLDHLCGEWTGGRRKPALTIFKAAPGYMAAWGKKPKKGETGDCYLIERVNGNLCIRYDIGYTYLCYDEGADTLNIYPGGEYKRAAGGKK